MRFQVLAHQLGRQDCVSQLSFGQQRKSRDLQGLGELDIRKKTIPSPAGNVMEALSSQGAWECGQEQLYWPGPGRQQWPEARESCYST